MSVSRVARLAYRWTAWLFVACVIVQFFLAGLGVFAGATNFSLHRDWGYTFGWLTIILLALALIGRMPRQAIGGALLLIVLFTLQSVFVGLRTSAPTIAALHPVNAVAIFWVSTWLARSAAAWQEKGAHAPAEPAEAAEPAR
jgi:mercuric ion transport protein